MSADRRPSILFFDSACPGSLPPAFGLDPEDSVTIVGGVEAGLARYISATAADLAAHYTLQGEGDIESGDYFLAATSRRRADDWLTCHEEASAALCQIYLARAN